MASQSILLVYPLDGHNFGEVHGPYTDPDEAETDGLALTGEAPMTKPQTRGFTILPLKPKLPK